MNKKINLRVRTQGKKDIPKLHLEVSQHIADRPNPVSTKLLPKNKMKEICELISLWLAEELETDNFELNQFLGHLLDYQISFGIESSQLLKNLPDINNYRESQITISKKWVTSRKNKTGMRSIPVLTLSGDWLHVRGFEIGEICKVITKDGSILIQTVAKHG